MKCTKCGAELSGKFCTNCGAPAPVNPVCTNCGAELTGRFCTKCGTPAENATENVAPVAPVVENTVEPVAPVENVAEPVQPVENIAEPVASEPEPIQYTPAQPTVEPMQYNPVQPIAEPMQNVEPMPYNPAQPMAEPMQYNQAPQQNMPNGGQMMNQTSFGQQFTNQPNGGYAGQQFTNQPSAPQPPKKGMSTGKIVALVLGIVGAVIILFGIIVGVTACNIVNESKNAVYDLYDDYNDFFNDYY